MARRSTLSVILPQTNHEQAHDVCHDKLSEGDFPATARCQWFEPAYVRIASLMEPFANSSGNIGSPNEI